MAEDLAQSMPERTVRSLYKFRPFVEHKLGQLPCAAKQMFGLEPDTSSGRCS